MEILKRREVSRIGWLKKFSQRRTLLAHCILSGLKHTSAYALSHAIVTMAVAIIILLPAESSADDPDRIAIDISEYFKKNNPGSKQNISKYDLDPTRVCEPVNKDVLQPDVDTCKKKFSIPSGQLATFYRCSKIEQRYQRNKEAKAMLTWKPNLNRNEQWALKTTDQYIREDYEKLQQCHHEEVSQYWNVRAEVNVENICGGLERSMKHRARRGETKQSQWYATQLKECQTRIAWLNSENRKARVKNASTRNYAEILQIPAILRLKEETQALKAAMDLCIQNQKEENEKARIARNKSQDSYSKCEKKLEGQTQVRRGQVAQKTYEELQSIPKKYRITEENERIEVLEKEHRALIEKRKKSKKWVKPLLSAGICYGKNLRKLNSNEIKEEKRYARKYSGYVDKSKIYQHQQNIRDADSFIAMIKKILRKRKFSETSCGNKTVKKLLRCSPFSEVDAEICESKNIKEFLEIIDIIPW